MLPDEKNLCLTTSQAAHRDFYSYAEVFLQKFKGFTKSERGRITLLKVRGDLPLISFKCFGRTQIGALEKEALPSLLCVSPATQLASIIYSSFLLTGFMSLVQETRKQ